MVIFITIVHVLLAVFMIFVILLQPGKDAGMGAAFGGGAATSAFGGRGAVTFLSKLTAGCAVLFFLTSLGLSFVGMGTSVAAQLPPPAATAPAPSTNPTVEQGAQTPPPPAEQQPSDRLQDAPLPTESGGVIPEGAQPTSPAPSNP